MATNPQQLIAKFEVEKETKNTIKFSETDDSPAAGAIGSLYVNKYAVRNTLGGADKLTVLIEAGHSV